MTHVRASILRVVVFFLLFGSRREEGKTGETVRKDSWHPRNAVTAELKTQIFLCCTGLNLSNRLPYCLAIQIYRIAAVCFVILTVKEVCEAPTQILRSEGRTKVTCCVVAKLRFINFAILL